MAKREQVSETFSDLVGGDKKAAKKDKQADNRPIGVALSHEQIAKLDKIAAAIEQSRSEVIRYAIDDLIKRYDSGEIQPVTETRTETVKLLKHNID